jgi:hypothetical protein
MGRIIHTWTIALFRRVQVRFHSFGLEGMQDIYWSLLDAIPQEVRLVSLIGTRTLQAANPAHSKPTVLHFYLE